MVDNGVTQEVSERAIGRLVLQPDLRLIRVAIELIGGVLEKYLCVGCQVTRWRIEFLCESSQMLNDGTVLIEERLRVEPGITFVGDQGMEIIGGGRHDSQSTGNVLRKQFHAAAGPIEQ